MRYRQILDEALKHEDKAHRDQVLAKHPDQAAGVRHIMAGLARKLATAICFAGVEKNLSAKSRRELRRKKLDQVEPLWLRRRVETMVVERFQQAREQINKRDFDRMREAVQ